MEIIVPIVLFTSGIMLIYKAAGIFVDALVWISEESGIPKFIIGTTIMSIATTMPEIFASFLASMSGATDMALGNAVGSVICNLGLIMGISIFAIPWHLESGVFIRNSMIMLLSAGVFGIFIFDGYLSIGESLSMLVMVTTLLISSVINAKYEKSIDIMPISNEPPDKKDMTKNIVRFIISAAAIFLGSSFFVTAGVYFQENAGISENIIGLTVMAAGTSLPELITIIAAIVKRESELTVGNIIGSNIVDLLFVTAGSSLITGHGMAVGAQMVFLDLPVAVLIMLVAVIPTMITGKLSKVQGVALLTIFAVYVTYLIGRI